MEQKLRSCKLNLREVLVAYGINKEGLITVDLLAAVLARLDAGLGPEDLRMVLELIAGQPATTVSLQQFEHYYQSCLAGRAAELAQRRANSS
jgi:Ca2+-binding EF-hand superfamily protein